MMDCSSTSKPVIGGFGVGIYNKNYSKTQSFETFYIELVTKIRSVMKMDTFQNRKDEALGELWNCKEEIKHRATKKSVEHLIRLLEEYKPIDVVEILDLIHDLKFKVESNNYCNDEELKFDLDDVKKSIEREWKIKKSKSSNITYKGGRPSIINEYIREYVYLKEGHTFTYNNETEFWNIAKFRLSRTSYWRLRKKIEELNNKK